MDINALISRVNSEYVPLKLKSREHILSSSQEARLERLSIELEVYRILKSAFTEEMTRNKEITASMVSVGLITTHKETVKDAEGKEVEVDVPDGTLDERVSLMPDAYTHPIIEKMIKGCRENIDIFRKTGDERKLRKEQTGMDVLESLLPKEATESEILEFIDRTWPEGIERKMTGKVIGEIKKAFSRVDGKVAAKCAGMRAR